MTLPDDSDAARYAQGCERLEAGQFDAAESLLSAVKETSPEFARAQYHRGIGALRAGRLEAAAAHFSRAAASDPELGAAWNNLGDVQLRMGRLDEAEASFRRAMQVTPSLAEAFYNLGTLTLQSNRLVEAEACLHRAIVLRPDFAHAYNNLSEVMLRTQRVEQAESCVRQAIALAPGFAQAHYNLGNLMLLAGRAGEAERSFRRALELQPDFADANSNLARLLLGQRRAAEAETLLRAEVATRPGASAYNLLGSALMAQQRVDEALACFREAVALDPDSGEARYNEGGALMTLNRLDEAVDALQRGYALAPELAAGRLILGMTLLKLGRYREGWPHYEYFTARRASGQGRSALADALPEWQGEPLAGRSLIVLCDYGFGDSIQFVRFMSALKARGLARLTLLCPPELKTLFESVAAVDVVKSTEDHIDLRQSDCWCYLPSVPLRLDVTLDTLEARLPYLSVGAARIKRWRTRLDAALPAAQAKVGVLTSGKPRTDDLHAALMDEQRSLAHVGACAALLAVPGVSFVSLHKDPLKRAQWRELPETLRPFDPMGEVEDFADTAALIRNLDLVVTTDTAVAHLAGALDTPCWLMLNDDSDWRWLCARTDSPWYPGALRLFRQPRSGAWEAVIDEVAAALPAWLARPR
ncbi:tetratricopeptide repeat protein [Paraburkholderia sp. Ac-20347]|uniref:tetratricopeptide repeat protein n=1 Tax=Paraburkholderia sp. Ac-20347 TaxID=2703892 RepID=UPI00197D4F2E|nr:tetratricopeptide repeat protein [Paraburkholderia sp. Ac-20347]MBN3808825.1 tetratricopeptide repeat protein [Paraburkholderia sp. Ac-20347]